MHVRSNASSTEHARLDQLAVLKTIWAAEHGLTACSAGSQVFTRLGTFGLNQIVTKALSVEAYGVSTAQPGQAHL